MEGQKKSTVEVGDPTGSPPNNNCKYLLVSPNMIFERSAELNNDITVEMVIIILLTENFH